MLSAGSEQQPTIAEKVCNLIGYEYYTTRGDEEIQEEDEEKKERENETQGEKKRHQHYWYYLHQIKLVKRNEI